MNNTLSSKSYSKYIKYWNLDTNFIFLNHGSFGATPKAILKKQEEYRIKLEKEPVKFYIREIEELLFQSKRKLASFIRADKNDIVFVPNATYGVNSILKSLKFKDGDELLTTNHEYYSCKNTLEYVAKRNNVKVVIANIPFPIKSEDEVILYLLKHVSNKTKILLIDHITSPTGLVFPIDKILKEFNARGIDVLVDGAHSAGMVNLNIKKLNPAFYTGNCHKWLCTPKGSGFLFVRKDKQESIYPAITTFADPIQLKGKWTKFQTRFYWLGTLDISPFLCVGDTIDYLEKIFPKGLKGIIKHNHNLALEGRKILIDTLMIENPSPESMIGSMASIPLPPAKIKTLPHLYIDDIQNRLFFDFKIEVPIMFFPQPPYRLIRISAQIYNSLEQYQILASALKKILKL